MNTMTFFKEAMFSFLWRLKVDSLFRYINKNKILILAYHGVTKKEYETPIWSLIPIDAFERQIEYLNWKYNVISLRQVAESIISGIDLPRNPAVITFDDGYRNNFTLALPILEKYGTPATIFLATGYIGSSRLMPLDESYVILSGSKKAGTISIPEIGLDSLLLDTSQNLLLSYEEIIHRLKEFATRDQEEYLTILRQFVDVGRDEADPDLVADFRMLSWEEIRSLLQTGLIHIGAHTVSHQILTKVSHQEAAKEIVASKAIIQEKLDYQVNLFAYPNGSEDDYDEEHIKCLKNNGFICSVTTMQKLNSVHVNPYRLGRMCIGPYPSANQAHFALMLSGFISAMKPF